jgi:hypothetical protein
VGGAGRSCAHTVSGLSALAPCGGAPANASGSQGCRPGLRQHGPGLAELGRASALCRARGSQHVWRVRPSAHPERDRPRAHIPHSVNGASSTFLLRAFWQRKGPHHRRMAVSRGQEPECPVGVLSAGALPRDRSVARPASTPSPGLRRPTGARQPAPSLRADGEGGGRRDRRAGFGVGYTPRPPSAVPPGSAQRTARPRPALRPGRAPAVLARRSRGPGPRAPRRLRPQATLPGLGGPDGQAVWPGAPLWAITTGHKVVLTHFS